MLIYMRELELGQGVSFSKRECEEFFKLEGNYGGKVSRTLGLGCVEVWS